jgi:DMSO/TMAO reductase YedYZ molybdopterin-dependent catalytic subunit
MIRNQYLGAKIMSPRLTDWSLALAVGIAFASGILSLISGRPEDWMIFALHGMAGLWLALLLWGKLRRVLPRLVQPRRWDRATLAGAGAALIVALAVGSGIWWAFGGELFVAGFNLMNWHILLGLVLTAAVSLHMLARAKPLRSQDMGGRRQLLRWGVLALGGAALWPAQQSLGSKLQLPGADRRFTGAREAGSYAGNAFPATSWIADRPRPIESAAWRLEIAGAVARSLTLGYADLLAWQDTIDATLDCTGGFYSTQRWRGALVGRLLNQAGVMPNARWVSFVSVTGYRWSLPLGEARAALLATHIGAEPLEHGHGAPARLVAPGRRGFEWVKWVVRIDALATLDAGQVVSIYSSSFTPAGRGQIPESE